jgi:hypothetical protein
MKTIKYIFIAMFSLALATSCSVDGEDELTGGATEGGLVTLDAGAIGYVVGNDGTYIASGEVFQGRDKTTSIDVFKSFTDSDSGLSTEELLFESISLSDIQQGLPNDFSFQFKYENLIEGFPSISTTDSDLNIGDFWTLKFVSTLEDGTQVTNASTVKVSVGTRFAGLYKTVEAEYYRIGVLTYTEGDWPAETLIESVDATTYRVVEYFGAFNGNEWYFQIDENDKITYPDKTPDGDAQLGNGQPFITCAANAGDMTNVPCGATTNIVIRDDVDGKDRLVMSFGYFTAGSGSREFYQVLEKIVE